MHHALGPHTHLGYCTNVHAGPSYHQTLANLRRHALAVKQRVSPAMPMGVGLWLSAQAVRQMIAEQRVKELRDWLADHGLYVFTLNGFPYGNFHDSTVKHRVYQPDWRDPLRYDYTWQLAQILAELLPAEAEGSISTLPIGWRAHLADKPNTAELAATQLTELVHRLARLELDTGKHIHINLEPEPGCLLDTSEDVVNFFNDHLLGSPDDVSVRGYLRVCHDVCHTAVMFEDQRDVFKCYQNAGLQVGKVQLSSALRISFDAMDDASRAAAFEQLARFAEGRYLHQTVVRGSHGETTLYEDLPDALARAKQEAGPTGEWRVHFHVPIHLEKIGLLHTTHDEVKAALRVASRGEVRHFEVETYAWNVLPEELQPKEMADGLAEEMKWVIAQAPMEARG